MTMRFMFGRGMALLLILLAAGSVLAQEEAAAATEAAPATGLTLGMLLIGIGGLLLVGLLTAGKDQPEADAESQA
ncbi:MAG: hypothetical protein MUE40_01580 [Anaerolineae bacterium]|nr:hypothetical protein [Anaerolineae bacterium]